jgi:uncharacterized phosphosugar-binding protein
MLVDGYLVSTAYTGFVSDLFSAKTTNNTAWTEDYIKGAAPISSWFTQANVQMAMHGFGWSLWAANNVFGNDGGLLDTVFIRVSQLSLIAPIIDVVLTVLANNSYKTCGDLSTT